MTTMDEVEMAVSSIRESNLEQFVVLQCTGNYPSRLENTNLRVMQTYRRELNCLVGYSDHTKDMINPVAATAMGACIFEKHFTLDNNMPGPDHRMSLEPDELKATVDIIRKTELALGSTIKKVLPEEEENRTKLRKSIVAAVEIPVGTKLKREMLTVKRPGTGISPTKIKDLLHYQARTDIKKDSTILYEMLEK